MRQVLKRTKAKRGRMRSLIKKLISPVHPNRYWLDPKYHGHGLMAKALKMMLKRVSIDEVGKRKFNAHAFEGNWASRRTLEKAGFVIQPDIHVTRVKDGKEINLWTMRLFLTEKDAANYEVIPEETPRSEDEQVKIL